MKSRVHPNYKTKYRVGNWPAYDRALVQRGDVTLWLTPETIATWEAVGVGQAWRTAAVTDMTAEPASAHTFELLLNSLKQAGSLIETPVRSGSERAPRYVAQLPVRYRWQDDKAWFNGMTANISTTGLLFALDYADTRIIRDRPAPPDNPLRLAIEIRTTPESQLPASISCSARYVRTSVAPGRVFLNAIGVVVGTWQLKRSRGAAG